MRSTRRHGGDNGYRSAEDYSNEGRGYERPSSYTDRYRFERDETDYRGQGHDYDDNRNNNPDRSNRNEYNSRNREWSNHQSGWNDSGANWGNRGNDRYNENTNRNSGNWGSSSYGRGSEGGAPRSLNYNDDRRFETRYPQDNDYRNRQNSRGNDPYYNPQNDFIEDEDDLYGERTTNRNGYNENVNNAHRPASYRNNQYGNVWNRDNNPNANSSRRSRQGFGSLSKDRRQEPAGQGGRSSNENR